MSRFNTIESLRPQDDSDEFSCVDLYAVVEGRARPNPQRPLVGTGTGKNERSSRDEKEQLQRMADNDAEQRKMIRAKALEQKSSRRLDQVQATSYPSIEKHKDMADSAKGTSCNDKIESSDKPRFKPSCSSSQSTIPHRSPAAAPRRKLHDIPVRSVSPAPRGRHHTDSAAGASVDAKVPDTNHTRARRRSTMDNSFIGYQPDRHNSSAPRSNRDINKEAGQVPTKPGQGSRSRSIDKAPSRSSVATSRHDTNNQATSSVGAQVPALHTRARRRSTMDNSFIGLQIDLRSSSPATRRDVKMKPQLMFLLNQVKEVGVDPSTMTMLQAAVLRRSTMDNAFIGYQPDLHHGSAPRSSRDINNEATTQVPTKRSQTCRSGSIDDDNAPSRSSVATSRQDKTNEASSSVGAQDPAQHMRARRRSTMDNAFIGYQPDLQHSSAPKSSRDINNESATQVPIKPTQAFRGSSVDNASIVHQPVRHPSDAQRSRRDVNTEATAFADAQVPAEKARAGRSISIDKASIAFLPELHRNAAQRSRGDINKEPTSSSVAHFPAKHTLTRERLRNSMDNQSVGIHTDPSGPSPLPRKKPSMHSIDGSGIQAAQPQSYIRSKGLTDDIAKPSLSPKINGGKSSIIGRQTLCKTPVHK
ncbi:hypothetical protein MHU86_18370 [Fragilaria crotonensis]|nr:hypothetical protein MHU86_18370 [Fragilaria crotonensis]